MFASYFALEALRLVYFVILCYVCKYLVQQLVRFISAKLTLSSYVLYTYCILMWLETTIPNQDKKGIHEVLRWQPRGNVRTIFQPDAHVFVSRIMGCARKFIRSCQQVALWHARWSRLYNGSDCKPIGDYCAQSVRYFTFLEVYVHQQYIIRNAIILYAAFKLLHTRTTYMYLSE